jgi:predicted DNA-binding transcriptional regulator YafY
MGISCDRRTLSKDIALLNEYGYEILDEMCGHEKGYYIIDRSFSVPELKVMMDAVHSAAFITEKKADKLITKIASLGNSHKANLLKRNQTCFNTHRHSNEAIYYSIDACELTLHQKKRLVFYYFDLNERLEHVYRKNKKRYEVEPMAMIFNNNNYYLMCFSSKYDCIANYRLDRMEQVEVLDEPVTEGAIIHSADVSHFTNQTFNMYGGPVENAVLQFSDKLIGVVYDQFGEQTQMIRQNDNTCIATVQIQKSPTFWG